MKALAKTILRGGVLGREMGEQLLEELAPLRVSAAQAAAYLTLLASRPATVDLAAALADGLLARAARPAVCDLDLCARAVDIVGTGGDSAGTMNISTCAAILVAACGVPVVKHGNRAVSSQTGSADVLAALGMPTGSSEGGVAGADSDAKMSFERTGFCFLFAPHYHTATAALGPVRRELAAIGIVSVFNMLGPLVNPARPPFGVFGAYSHEVAELMAGVLAPRTADGGARYFVVCSEPAADGAGGMVTLDEATPMGPFMLHDVARGEILTRRIEPMDFGICRCDLRELRGGDAAQNAGILRALFVRDSGAVRGAGLPASQGLIDAVVLNAALGLEVSGRCATLGEALSVARAALDSGAVGRKLMAMEECWGIQRSAAMNQRSGAGSGGVCRG